MDQVNRFRQQNSVTYGLKETAVWPLILKAQKLA